MVYCLTSYSRAVDQHCATSLKHRKSIRCHFCNRVFASPSAYAQHVESGIHGINRHQVTRAVHSLRVVPTITLPTQTWLAGIPSSRPAIIEVQALSAATHQSRRSILPSNLTVATVSNAPAWTYTTYIATGFSGLGIPYACHFCRQTFRSVHALTQHMNSAVHDPNAFKCPGRCRKQFKLVSGLMQHLESGSCGLTSRKEIHARFGQLMAPFSKLLKA